MDEWIYPILSQEDRITFFVILACRITAASKARSGENAGDKCVFPFIFRGKTCPGPKCCDLSNEGKGSWCATKVDDYGELEPGHWAYCKGARCDPDGKS